MTPPMKSRKGYTLAELMVSMTIAILVVGAVVSVFMTVNTSAMGLSESIALNARTRVIQDRVAFDIRNMKSVSSIGTAPQTFTGTVYDYASGNSYSITYTLTTAVVNNTTQGVLKRTVNGTTTIVLDGLVVYGNGSTDYTSASDYSQFRYANRLGTETTATETTTVTSINTIRFDLVPAKTARQKSGLTRSVYDPFCSALFHLRNFGTSS